MSFSYEWEKTYKASGHQSIWPWSDLVSYVMRYSRPNNKKFRVLELGCGAGANIPFFKSLGIEYFGIDGSKTVISDLKKRFPEYSDGLIVGDFTKIIPFNKTFDLIVDRASLTHNSTKTIYKCIEDVLSPKLKTGGKFIGIDWFSTEHDDYNKAMKNNKDHFVVDSFEEGQFAGIGLVHFSDELFIKDLFKNFKIEILEHKTYDKIIPIKHRFASWNFVAIKD